LDIRTATEGDLGRIMELVREFGHSMLYQKSKELMETYLSRILVAEERVGEDIDQFATKKIVGFYHYIVSGDTGFAEMLRCYRQFPERLIEEAIDFRKFKPHSRGDILCVCMQGGSHREVFREFVLYLQKRLQEIWCYCSVRSHRTETYEQLGFTFNPKEQYTFFNIHAGRESTYRLGRWTRPSLQMGDIVGVKRERLVLR